MGDDPRVIPDPPALTFCFVLWKYPPCEPLASRVFDTSLQSKGAPSDISHKADVAPLLIRGGGGGGAE